MAQNKQIIMITGIMGSKLKCGKNNIWPFNLSNINIEKDLNTLSDINNPNIKPDGVTFFRHKLLIDLLKSICKDVIIFDYDWRQNNINHINRLKKVLNPMADEIIIIGYSMGATIAKIFLNAIKNEDIINKIKKFITLGGPWNGSVEAFKVLKYGMSNFIIKNGLKNVVSNFKSMYQLLPNSKYVNESPYGFLQDFREFIDWKKTYNEFYLPLLNKEGYDANDIFTKFYDYMNEDIKDSIIHHEIIGFNVPTLIKIINPVDSNFIEVFGNGDGSVPLYSAISKSNYQYFIKEKHSRLPNNILTFKILEDIINEKEYSEIIEDKFIYKYDEVKYMNYKFNIQTKLCTNNVSLIDEEAKIVYENIEKYNDLFL